MDRTICYRCGTPTGDYPICGACILAARILAAKLRQALGGS